MIMLSWLVSLLVRWIVGEILLMDFDIMQDHDSRIFNKATKILGYLHQSYKLLRNNATLCIILLQVH